MGNIDGIFEVKTLEAVRAFQADNGLAVDGIAGSKTWAELEAGRMPASVQVRKAYFEKYVVNPASYVIK